MDADAVAVSSPSAVSPSGKPCRKFKVSEDPVLLRQVVTLSRTYSSVLLLAEAGLRCPRISPGLSSHGGNQTKSGNRVCGNAGEATSHQIQLESPYLSSLKTLESQSRQFVSQSQTTGFFSSIHK